MVVSEVTGTYDAYDSINELLDKLELEAKASKNMIDEPWTAQL
jgi:hypothetical protein